MWSIDIKVCQFLEEIVIIFALMVTSGTNKQAFSCSFVEFSFHFAGASIELDIFNVGCDGKLLNIILREVVTTSITLVIELTIRSNNEMVDGTKVHKVE